MSWEDLPNFIPSIEFLYELGKQDHAVALCMLAFVDIPDSNFCEEVEEIPDGIPSEITDKVYELIVHRLRKIFNEPDRIFLKSYEPIDDVDQDYVDKIYNIINIYKQNGITIDYFNVDNLITSDTDLDDEENKQYEFITNKLKQLVGE